jgi:carbonic anhydrase
MINDGHSIQVNFPAKDIKETLTLAGKPYRLVQFHLHSPSENQWHGRSFPMEIHFVHQSSDGQLVVMGVFVNAGKQNTTFQQLMDHLPQSQGTSFLISGVSVNPANLLPTQRDYYEFDGSLTTPPCTEGVHWIVMAEPITASPAQINSLRNAAGGANARPVQPLHHRTISYFKNV